MSAGMVKITIATRLATMSATIAATCALTLLDAINTSSVTTARLLALGLGLGDRPAIEIQQRQRNRNAERRQHAGLAARGVALLDPEGDGGNRQRAAPLQGDREDRRGE